MRVTGVGLWVVDVNPEDATAYNHWWETVAGPEYAALPEVISVRQYVSPPKLQKLRRFRDEEGWEDGKATYLQIFFIGATDLAKADAGITAAARSLTAKCPRNIHVHGRNVGMHRLKKSYARKGMDTPHDAIPFIGHNYTYFSIGLVGDRTKIDDVEAWYDKFHIPDFMVIPGFLSVHMLRNIDSKREDRLLKLYYLDGDPAPTFEIVKVRMLQWKEQGRLNIPAPIRPLFNGPYRTMQPFEKDSLR